MGVLDQFSPTQRQALMYGAPVVAAFALIAATKRKAAPAEESAPAKTVVMAPATANTDAIGVGQLAQFESSITAGLLQVQGELERMERERARQAPVVLAPPPPPAAPAYQATPPAAFVDQPAPVAVAPSPPPPAPAPLPVAAVPATYSPVLPDYVEQWDQARGFAPGSWAYAPQSSTVGTVQNGSVDLTGVRPGSMVESFFDAHGQWVTRVR